MADRVGVIYPPYWNTGAMPSPVRKKVVAHNPQRPTKSGNGRHRLYNPPLVRNDSRDGINHLLYAKMAQPPLVCSDGMGNVSYVLLLPLRGMGNVSYVLLLPLRGMGNGKIKTPRRSVV